MSADLQPCAVADAFYQAMAARDFLAMSELYADCFDIHRSCLWHARCRKYPRHVAHVVVAQQGYCRQPYDISASDTQAVTRWVAHYSFGKTGRPVKNTILATMEIRDGKIIRHSDDFDMQDWLKQALGWPGVLFGWLPLFRSKVSAGAQAQLAAFIEKEKERSVKRRSFMLLLLARIADQAGGYPWQDRLAA